VDPVVKRLLGYRKLVADLLEVLVVLVQDRVAVELLVEEAD
jgi:hypothetical protein